jgi:hypothetical protein
MDVDTADAVVFICEWTTEIQYGDRLDLAKVVAKVPRSRRLVIDCDGKYNDAIAVLGDRNHPDEVAARQWTSECDSLSDKIFQPTLRPRRKNVGSFLFHGYDTAWERPLNPHDRDFGMLYVGNNWFRWRSLRYVLGCLEPVREKVGRIGLVGNGWDSLPPWANNTVPDTAYESDIEYLRELGVEVFPSIRFDEVVPTMGRGLFNPVIYRPLFDELRLVTCRGFETPASASIPLFVQAPEFVAEIYGDDATELVLPPRAPEEKIVDIMRRPEHYAAVVGGVRNHLAEHHSYARRTQHLIDLIEG